MNFAYLQVVRICNQKCIFCAQPSNWKIESYNTLKKEIDKYISLGFLWIIFTWWEPTLHKDLDKLIRYAKNKWLYTKIITNWINFSDKSYLYKIISSWIDCIHLSFHSYISQIEDSLMRNKWVYKRQIEAINNINYYKNIDFVINIVMNNYTVWHLDKTVLFLLKNFWNINWFILNMLEVSWVVEWYLQKLLFPLEKLKSPLNKTLKNIYFYDKSFRVSRVPMCYMKWYEESSRDCEYFIWESKKYIDYLSNNQGGDFISDSNNWKNEKDYLEECKNCSLKSICSWFDLNRFFKKESIKLYPYTKDKYYLENIINKYNKKC